MGPGSVWPGRLYCLKLFPPLKRTGKLFLPLLQSDGELPNLFAVASGSYVELGVGELVLKRFYPLFELCNSVRQGL